MMQNLIFPCDTLYLLTLDNICICSPCIPKQIPLYSYKDILEYTKGEFRPCRRGGVGKRGPRRRRRKGGEQRKNREDGGNAQGHEYRKYTKKLVTKQFTCSCEFLLTKKTAFGFGTSDQVYQVQGIKDQEQGIQNYKEQGLGQRDKELVQIDKGLGTL